MKMRKVEKKMKEHHKEVNLGKSLEKRETKARVPIGGGGGSSGGIFKLS